MTNGAWIMLGIVWTLVATLTVFLVGKVLRTPPKD